MCMLAFALCPCLLSLLLFDIGTNHHKKLQVLKTLPLGCCPFPTCCKDSRVTSAGNGISDSIHTRYTQITAKMPAYNRENEINHIIFFK